MRSRRYDGDLPLDEIATPSSRSHAYHARWVPLAGCRCCDAHGPLYVAQPRLVGSLIRTMIEFSTKSAGMPVTHIELSHGACTCRAPFVANLAVPSLETLSVGVSIVTDESSNVVCALFYDRADGAEFGRLMASDILRAFLSGGLQRARGAVRWGFHLTRLWQTLAGISELVVTTWPSFAVSSTRLWTS